ncbi:uncharacterized protein CANTADRAFT_88057 [Suhomyces tanzawaensis NRRL Y-17324]|uniref:Autophagy-related protein 13 n=1 Tax=Suhomyces tanzawaensis NRRL Y-17324 TaxID=984487 RepID=A0A1E4SRU9_9ASCO|nr:uncharacterized protein CANTADRAFT_88057 [Suhomyces tanzawaensis NRRL Y-17324]ODV82132.1 hypothetical protein CANTADRAFT_88057 [Suhomyces tanzawaensis NRRL Y-17324]
MYSNESKKLDPFVKKQNAKLTQVIQNFFNKAVQIVLQSRSLDTSTMQSSLTKNEDIIASKINKWFNLHMYNHPELSKDDLKLWKSCTDLTSIPPMIIETYLDLRQLTPSQTAVLKDDNGNEWTVAKTGSKKQEIVLERWLIEFDPNNVSGSLVDELPLIYKQAIILFRSMYGFSRLMPAFKLKKALAVNLASSKLSKLSLGNKILDGKQPILSKGRIGLSKSIIPHQMLTTESHVSHKHFQPIQTTLGTLKVSIAYRNHHDFAIHDNEEVLSTHFISMDTSTPDPEVEAPSKISSIDEELSSGEGQAIPNRDKDPNSNAFKRLSILSNASMSISPTSSGHRDTSISKKSSTPISQRPSIQPFKVGSITHTPTNSNTGAGSSLERRVSITSNKSTSNASLAALLRNPRSSTSSTHSFVNAPVSTSSGNTPIAVNISSSPHPRSVSSSHGSNLAPDEAGIFSNLEGASNTPRFSSSFGSRASRRFSNTSIRQSSLSNAGQGSGTGGGDTSILGTSTELTTSSGAPLSGLYIDDDISDFVRMIDSKSELRFSSYNHDSKQSSPFPNDPLNKFQLLKGHHQQIGENVSASLLLNNPGLQANSRHSSRKSSHSMYSPPGSLPSGSYEHSQLPSINSRLRERRSSSSHDENARKNSFPYSSHHSNASFLKAPLASMNRLAAAPITSTTSAHATAHGPSSKDAEKASGVKGLATTPSAYDKRTIHYENVFDDDDDEVHEDDPHYYLSNNHSSENLNSSNRGAFHNANHNRHQSDDYDDDLLFTMSDMNLTKN